MWAVTKRLQNHVGGRYHEARGQDQLPVMDPARDEVIGYTPLSNNEDVKEACEAAQGAFESWAATPVAERARYMFAYRDILERNMEELARLVTRENGKTLSEAMGEVRRGIEVVEFACGMPSLMMGETVEDVSRNVDSEVYRYPLGVCLGICPFNFPAMIPLWMFPIAVAAGNTFILKPSERAPITSMRLVELLYETGLPDGVMNLVHGAAETVNALLERLEIKAVSFVGSQPAAAEVYARAAAAGKRVQALGGAKNHLIVMPDAKLEPTVQAIVSSAFGNAGERCLAGSVVVAVGRIADPLVEALRDITAQLKLGPGDEEDSELGPLIRSSHRAKVESYIEKGLEEGATLVLDGRKAQRPEQGYFLAPSLFDHVRPEMVIAQEEIFGPILCVIRVQTLDEALDVVNASRYGNAASIFTQSGAAARKFRSRVQAGMLGVNIGVAAPMAFFPFTGWKSSFYGDLHATGKDAVTFYTEKKVVTTRWF